MFEPEGLQNLARHLEWADSSLWTAVLAHGTRDAKVDEWLHHIHVVQHAFQRLWRSEPLELPELMLSRDHPSLVVWGREAHAGIRRFLSVATDEMLSSKLSVPWTEELEKKWDRPMQAVTIAESVVQVAMHSAHHRAQVAARLREIGGEPPQTDFIVWGWLGRPHPVWPET